MRTTVATFAGLVASQPPSCAPALRHQQLRAHLVARCEVQTGTYTNFKF